ncbi:MAG: hypothetical protein ABIH20_06550 [Candidatus Diapherotrites archaeon]
MYSLISKLLVTGKLKFEPGKITAFNDPFALIDLDSLKAMTDDAIVEGGNRISDLYFYGWVFGYNTTRNMISLLKLKKFEERYKISMDVIGLLGFGDYQTISFQRANHAKFKVIGNPFALLYHPSNSLVCHYIRGMEAGGGTLVHESLMDNIETECAAQNGNHCVHANLNQEKIDALDKKLVSSQMNREYVKKRQKKLIESHGDNPSRFGL